MSDTRGGLSPDVINSFTFFAVRVERNRSIDPPKSLNPSTDSSLTARYELVVAAQRVIWLPA
jgi:hypothetical protein